MDRFYYEIVAAQDAHGSVAIVKELIARHPALQVASEPWVRPTSPAQADLYALLVIASDGLSSDTNARRKVWHASAGGFPLIPVVADRSTYDFQRAPLPELSERNAEALNDPDRLLRSLLHHAGLELFEGGGHVFISYARKDGSELAEAIRDRLGALGLGRTMDVYAFPGGDLIQEDIERRIRSADLVVLIDSKGAARSQWVAEELDIAMSSCVQSIAVCPTQDAFHHYLRCPHVPWTQGADSVDNIADSVAAFARRILARKLAFRSRVSRTLSRIARLRDWDIAEHGERWRVRIGDSASVTVGYVPDAPPVDEVVRLRNAVQPERGVLVAGTRPFRREALLGFEAAGGSEVTVTPLSWLASRVPSGFAQRPLAERRVFLSAAMPSDPNEIELASVTLSPFIVGLVQSLVGLGATVVFGGHPSITPLVHKALSGIIGGDAGSIELHQARVWQGRLSTLPAEILEGPLFRSVSWHGEGDNPADDVAALRDAMISKNLDAAVFVGGKTIGFIGSRPGIVDEHERFLTACPDKRRFIVGLAGGAVVDLPVDESRVGETLRSTADPDLAVALIISELVGP